MKIGTMSLALAAVALAASASTASAQLFAITGAGGLYSINPVNAAATFIGNGAYGAGGPGSLEWNPGNNSLWANTIGGGSALYRVNPATGAAGLIGGNAINFVFEGGLQLSPGGTLYGVNGDNAGNAQLLTISQATGAAAVVGVMNAPGASVDVNGLGWRSDGVLLGIEDFGNRLITINPATAAIANLAALPAGVTAGAVGGMATFGNTGYFATQNGNLYSFNLFTGASALIGNMQIEPRGLALVPAPASLALLSLGGLLAARRRRA